MIAKYWWMPVPNPEWAPLFGASKPIWTMSVSILLSLSYKWIWNTPWMTAISPLSTCRSSNTKSMWLVPYAEVRPYRLELQRNWVLVSHHSQDKNQRRTQTAQGDHWIVWPLRLHGLRSQRNGFTPRQHYWEGDHFYSRNCRLPSLSARLLSNLHQGEWSDRKDRKYF